MTVTEYMSVSLAEPADLHDIVMICTAASMHAFALCIPGSRKYFTTP